MASSPGVEMFTGFNPAKRQLGDKLKTMFDEISRQPDDENPGHPADTAMMAEALTNEFQQTLDAVTGLEQKKFRLSSGTRLRVLYQVDEFLRDDLDRAIRTGQLCVETGVSQRSLEYLLRDYFGISPVRYLAMRRLHAVREKLMTARPDETTVADLAAAYGFRGIRAGLPRLTGSSSANFRRQPWRARSVAPRRRANGDHSPGSCRSDIVMHNN